MLRQFAVRLNQNTSFQLPVNNTTPSHADRRPFLIAIPNESVSDLPQLPRDVIETKTDPASTLEDSWVHIRFQTDLASRPSVYLLQSVLNL